MPNSIDGLHQTIAGCRACNFLKEYWRFSQESHGQCEAGIMVVGESSYRPSIEAGEYYASGSLRSTLSGIVDLDRECYLTDLVKCDKGYLNAKDYIEAAATNCHQFLEKEVELIKPTVIIAVGEMAFRYLTGITGQFSGRQGDGQQYVYKGIPVVPIVHPSYGNVHYGKKPWQTTGYHDSVRRIFAQALKM